MAKKFLNAQTRSIINVHTIFKETFKHPLAQRGFVEMLPAEWVASLSRHKDGTEKTDLGYWKNEEPVTMKQLWEDLLNRGMRDPFILGAGRVCRTCRLEAGNHRIALFRNKGIEFVPAVVLVGDSSITSIGNGGHTYEKELLIPEGWPNFGPYPEKIYMKPSDVFAEIKNFFEPDEFTRFQSTFNLKHLCATGT